MKVLGRSGSRRGCAVLTPAGAAPERAGEGERLFRAFAERLDLDDLEEALLSALRRDLPNLTAIVRLGDEQRVPQVSGPRPGRGGRRREAAGGLLAVPIEHAGAALGFVGYADDAALREAMREAGQRLALVAAEAAIPARNALRHAEAIEMAFKDPLTGLYNRRAMLEILEREARRALRHDRPLALLVLDLDNLKAINDSRGHAAGDAALRALAGVLQGTVRRADIVARLAGDEFVVVCPDTAAEAARRVGQRIERALAECEAPLEDGTLLVGLGVSWGTVDLAGAGARAGTPLDAVVGEMFELADADLYRAKAARRASVAAAGRGRA